MALSTCARCGKLYAKIRSAVCPACEKDEDADFVKIRNVLAHHPGLNVEQVAEAADVSEDCVLRMLDEGRIENTMVGDPIKCGRCGAPALSVTKKLCEACLTKLDLECSEAIRDIRESMKKQGESGARLVREIVREKQLSPGESRKSSETSRSARAKHPAMTRRMAVQDRLQGQNKSRGKPSK